VTEKQINNAAIVEEITREKKMYLARDEVYPHLKKVVDAILELKGVTMITAGKHDTNPGKLWEWARKQFDV
jgi:hypothetical protein